MVVLFFSKKSLGDRGYGMNWATLVIQNEFQYVPGARTVFFDAAEKRKRSFWRNWRREVNPIFPLKITCPSLRTSDNSCVMKKNKQKKKTFTEISCLLFKVME